MLEFSCLLVATMDPTYGPHLPQQQQQQQPNPFQAASDPGSPTGAQMLEVLGQMVQQSQEQVRTLGQQSQEQLRVLGRTLETVILRRQEIVVMPMLGADCFPGPIFSSLRHGMKKFPVFQNGHGSSSSTSVLSMARCATCWKK